MGSHVEDYRSYVWLLHGPRWSLPLRAAEVDPGMMRVRLAGTITEAMRQAANARLTQIGMHNGQDWWLTKEALRAHADLAQYDADEVGVDGLISWVSNYGRATLTEQPKGMEGFFEEFVRAGHAKTVPQAQVLYGAFCGHLFDWLANERKAVDLGFAVLEPLPVRSNWASVIAGRLRAKWLPGPGLTWAVARERVASWIAHAEISMYDRNNRVMLWTINLRHRRQWWRAIIGGETTRRRRQTLAYFPNIKRLLVEKKEVILALFQDFAAQARKPTLQLRPRPIPGVVRKPGFKYRRPWKRFGDRIRTEYDHVLRPPRIPRQSAPVDLRDGAKVEPATFQNKATQLSAMPDLRQWAEDLRDGLVEPREPAVRVEGEPRMCLLDAGGSVAPVEGLLGVGGDGRED